MVFTCSEFLRIYLRKSKISNRRKRTLKPKIFPLRSLITAELQAWLRFANVGILFVTCLISIMTMISPNIRVMGAMKYYATVNLQV